MSPADNQRLLFERPANTCGLAETVGVGLPRTIPKVIVPPLKCQGIKTKLVNFIASNVRWNGKGRWIEPFLGSGVVLFNMRPERALVSDTNKHIIRLYADIQSGKIDEHLVRGYLEEAARELSKNGEDYYYQVRQTFNSSGEPLALLFLNRSCFNGIMRFNKRGEHNVPFCRKPNRFNPAYITKICNQVKRVRRMIRSHGWEFRATTWRETIEHVNEDDFVYCDPPYIGRHTDYYNRWSDDEACALPRAVKKLPCGFAVSMWYENKYRKNTHVDTEWSGCAVRTFSHFYHVGSTESLRNRMTEALIINSACAS